MKSILSPLCALTIALSFSLSLPALAKAEEQEFIHKEKTLEKIRPAGGSQGFAVSTLQAALRENQQILDINHVYFKALDNTLCPILYSKEKHKGIITI